MIASNKLIPSLALTILVFTALTGIAGAHERNCHRQVTHCYTKSHCWHPTHYNCSVRYTSYCAPKRYCTRIVEDDDYTPSYTYYEGRRHYCRTNYVERCHRAESCHRVRYCSHSSRHGRHHG